VTVGFEPAQPGHVLESLARSIGSIPRVLLPDPAPEDTGVAFIKPSSDEMPAPAERGNRYQLFGEIARGGMGAVLKGRDPDLGRDLAVKVLLESHEDKPDLVRRFVEEAQIGGQLQHPGIVPVYELGAFADRRPYFTMKLVKGRTLASLLAERESPAHDLPRFLSIFESICQTVAYAHARGVIHRDLKPSNVMVGSFGEVQVMDWGLAKVLKEGGAADKPPAQPVPELSVIATVRSGSNRDESQAGSVLGTPAYMAPEQAEGDIVRVDRRADVFGLGSILCEILTSQPAYTGRSSMELLRKAMRGETADALTRLDSCGAEAELVALAKECLAIEPDDRPRDAGLVAGRITAHLTGVQERLRRAELARVEETARRRLTLAVAASIVGILILAGGGWGYLQQLRAGRRAATERVVNQALDEATLLWGQARSAAVGDLSPWSIALNAAKKAEGLLAAGEGDTELHNRVRTVLAALELGGADAQAKAREAKRDHELLDRLETIRSERSVHLNAERTDAEYQAAFREFGIDFETLDPKDAGKRLASRSAPVELASFLDDWTYVRTLIPPAKEKSLWRRLNEAARAADPNAWRDALRAQIRGTDKGVLPRLADDQKALEGQPAMSLLLLARWLLVLGDRPRTEAVLLRAWRLQPDDFWVNDQLGWLYLWGTRLWSAETKPAEAARYYSVAVAGRPRSFAAHMNLGVALCPIQLDRGVDELRESIRLDPNSAAAHINLAIGLNEQRKFPELVAEYREAIRHEPDSTLAHEGLALGLYRLGKPAEAIAEWREAIRLQPGNPKAHNNLAFALAVPPNRPRSDYHEALVHARRAVGLNPEGFNVGTLALAEYRAGHWAESLAAGERSLAMTKGGDANVWFVMALASWRKDEKDKARTFFDKAADWAMKHPRTNDDDQRQLWIEAAELLGRPGPPPPKPAMPPSDGASKPR